MSGTSLVHKTEATPIDDKPPDPHASVYQPEDDASAPPPADPDHDSDPRLDPDLPDGTEPDAVHDQPEPSEPVERHDEQPAEHAQVGAELHQQVSHPSHQHDPQTEHVVEQEAAYHDAVAEHDAYRGSSAADHDQAEQQLGAGHEQTAEQHEVEDEHMVPQGHEVSQQEHVDAVQPDQQDVQHDTVVSEGQGPQHDLSEAHAHHHDGYVSQEVGQHGDDSHEPQHEHVSEQAHIAQQEHAGAAADDVQQEVEQQVETAAQMSADHQPGAHEDHVHHQEHEGHLDHMPHDDTSHQHAHAHEHAHATDHQLNREARSSEHLQPEGHAHAAVTASEHVDQHEHDVQNIHDGHEQQTQHTVPEDASDPMTEAHAGVATIAAVAAEACERMKIASMHGENATLSPGISHHHSQRVMVPHGPPNRRIAERYHPSAEQLKCLIEAFEKASTPSAAVLNELSSTINMPMHNLVLWFKNRRARQKKKFPSAPTRTGKRSYVRSGVYSRNPPKRKMEQHLHQRAAVVETGTQSTVHVPSQAHLDLPEEEHAANMADIKKDGDGTDPDSQDLKRPLEEGESEGGSTPKRRRYSGVSELVGEENPCRDWDSRECHRRCLEFFMQNSRRNELDESEIARLVADKFFFAESQTGLTLTSAMQSLESSVDVLDEIFRRVSEEGHILTSGSRVLLREFLAQVRSGRAVDIQVSEVGDEGRFETETADVEATGRASGESVRADSVRQESIRVEGAGGESTCGEGLGGESEGQDVAVEEEGAEEEHAEAMERENDGGEMQDIQTDGVGAESSVPVESVVGDAISSEAVAATAE